MKRIYRDPLTGDQLTRGEYLSWKIQGVIRRWTVLLVILAATAICWSTRSEPVLLWWNLSASLVAIIIEFIVGLAMFGQTRRDAQVLREVRAMAASQEKTLDRLAYVEEQNLLQLQRIDQLLEQRKRGRPRKKPIPSPASEIYRDLPDSAYLPEGMIL